jgi:hypothetical protein
MHHVRGQQRKLQQKKDFTPEVDELLPQASGPGACTSGPPALRRSVPCEPFRGCGVDEERSY